MECVRKLTCDSPLKSLLRYVNIDFFFRNINIILIFQPLTILILFDMETGDSDMDVVIVGVVYSEKIICKGGSCPQVFCTMLF